MRFDSLTLAIALEASLSMRNVVFRSPDWDEQDEREYRADHIKVFESAQED